MVLAVGISLHWNQELSNVKNLDYFEPEQATYEKF